MQRLWRSVALGMVLWWAGPWACWANSSAPTPTLGPPTGAGSTAPAQSGRYTPRPVQPLKVGDRRFYRLNWNGTPIGYSAYEVTRSLQLGGVNFVLVKSQCRLKVGIGRVQDLKFNAEWLLNQKTLEPASFECTQQLGDKAYKVTCIFAPSIIAQVNQFGQMAENDHLDVDGPTFLYFNNLWGQMDTFADHYAVLAHLAGAGPVTVPVYDPILKGLGAMRIVPGPKEAVDLGNGKKEARRYEVFDWREQPLMTLWMDPASGAPVKMEEAGGGLTATEAGPSVVAETAKIAGLDLWADRVALSNVLFDNPAKITRLTAAISAGVKGTPALTQQLLGMTQTFEGDASNPSAISGVVTVAAQAYNGEHAGPFPPKGINDNPALAPYLADQPGLEINYPPLDNKALELTWRSPTLWDAAKKITGWVAANVKDGVSLPSARLALDTGEGNSESKALLVTALCRAAGIPARPVGGLVYSAGNFIPHYWTQVWMGETGWTSCDPTMNELGALSATHIALWEYGDVHNLAVTVQDYQPQPPARVAYFRRELNWPLGEERTYTLTREGKPIGTEVVIVKDLVLVGDQEAYRLEDAVDLTEESGPVKGTATLLVTPEGLPLHYSSNLAVSGTPQTQQYDFVGNKAVYTMTYRSQPVKREAPCPIGAYLSPAHFLGPFTLAVGQTPYPKTGLTFAYTLFDPSDLSLRTVNMTVAGEEYLLQEGGEGWDTYRLESGKAMTVWLSKEGQVVKMKIPADNLEVQLTGVAFKRPIPAPRTVPAPGPPPGPR